MGHVFSLPAKKAERETTITGIISRSTQLKNIEQVKWYISSFYMRGVRNFESVDYVNGTVALDYMNDSGVLRFRYEEILARYQAQLGRLAALDLSPVVSPNGVSLDGTRKASTGQVVLDAAFPDDKVEKLSAEIGPPLLHFGTIGLVLWYENEDSFGVEVVPPWELGPIPTNADSPSNARGVYRIRWVPKSWVKELRITPNKGSKVYKGEDSVEVVKGDEPNGVRDGGTAFVSMTSAGSGFSVKAKDYNSMYPGKEKKNDETIEDMTQLVEVWTETADGYLSEYAIYFGVGEFKELYHSDHSAHKYPMPIRIARDVTVNSFWGRAFVDTLIPLNQELEYALGSLFQAVSDFDLYGLVMWPATLGTPQEAVRGQDGLKKLVYEVDYTAPDQKPFNIEPAKLTGPQAQAIQIAMGLFRSVTNQPEELMAGKAPGRVDGSTGLGFLYETSSVPLSPTATSIAMAVSGIYRAMLRVLKDVWSDQKVVNVSKLDDSLAGVVLNQKDGTISMDVNAIPYPEEVKVTIASKEPVSVEQQKAELKGSLERGLLTPEEYAFEVRKRGYHIPVGFEIEWQNYRRAMLENIVLFGDGEKTGEVIVSDTDNHRIHKQGLLAFMSRPEFYLASTQVRDAFLEHYREHETRDGGFPEGLPMPEDMMDQMGGMGGMPPQMPM